MRREGSNARDVTVVMYHSVAADGSPYSIHREAFRRQVDTIAARYPVVPLTALLDSADVDAPVDSAHAHANRRCVSITFDDGYRDFLEHAYPVLAQLRLPATMFVPTGFVGGVNEWDAAAEWYVRRPLMTSAELSSLAQTGLVELGSHTVDHLRMTRLPIPEMRRQARESKLALESLGATVCSFAYPYGQLGDFSAETERVLAAEGYRIGVTTHWGTGAPRNLLRLRRIHFAPDDDTSTLCAKIEGRYDWISLKERTAFALRSLHQRARPRRNAA